MALEEKVLRRSLAPDHGAVGLKVAPELHNFLPELPHLPGT